jgi:Flp pilus assembly protein TadG
MRRHHPALHPGPNRSGKTLVMFALLLPLLLGMVGLALDSGLLLATYRQTQNAADAAATAAALDVYNNSSSTAVATGKTYVTSYNNMSGATVSINIGPSTGPHAGVNTYAEAIVTYPYSTSFIQLLGVNKSQSVTARAVAGYHLSSPTDGIRTLLQSPSGGSGLTVSGGGTLSVSGPITVNATDSTKAMDISGGSLVNATTVNVSGGITGTSELTDTTTNKNTGINYADPLAALAPPTTANGLLANFYTTTYNSSTNQWTQTSASSPRSVNINNSTPATLNPGVYTSITVNSSTGSATFNPGIYVLEGGGLTIQGGASVSGSGVMFYNTSTTYNYTSNTVNGVASGADGSGGQYTGITISGGSTFNITGYTGGPYTSMLVFQDRSNTKDMAISGTSTANVSGTFYAPTAAVTVSGGSTYNSQFIVGALTESGGQSAIKIVPPSSQGNLVYLVE